MKKKGSKSSRSFASSESDAVVLWKMGYARESFKYVRTTCDYITAQGLDRYSPAYFPLCVAIVVFYAQPFKRSRVIGMIPEQMVPDNHRSLHKQLLTLRDQVAANIDADAVSAGESGLPANHVRVMISKRWDTFAWNS